VEVLRVRVIKRDIGGYSIVEYGLLVYVEVLVVFLGFWRLEFLE
jgi:hypothetical protein